MQSNHAGCWSPDSGHHAIQSRGLLVAGLVLHLGAAAALAQHDEIERLEAATAVFKEMMDAPDEWIKGIFCFQYEMTP